MGVPGLLKLFEFWTAGPKQPSTEMERTKNEPLCEPRSCPFLLALILISVHRTLNWNPGGWCSTAEVASKHQRNKTQVWNLLEQPSFSPVPQSRALSQPSRRKPTRQSNITYSEIMEDSLGGWKFALITTQLSKDAPFSSKLSSAAAGHFSSLFSYTPCRIFNPITCYLYILPEILSSNIYTYILTYIHYVATFFFHKYV